MRNLIKISYLAIALLGTGCQSVGPKYIKQSHPQYNDAMTSTMDSQLLTNIVRLKYRENPMFLEISNITESRNLSFNTGIKDIRWFPHGKASTMYSTATALFTDSQSPTVSYRPVKGKEFTKHLMTPIPLNVVLGMASSGWKLPRVFNTCIERINDLENASNASGPMPWQKPSFEKFYEMTSLLKSLEAADIIVIGVDPVDHKDLLLRIKPTSGNNSDILKLKKVLGLDLDKNDFKFESNFLKTSTGGLVVRTRSLMGVLFYLSHAVEVPEEHIAEGLVQTTWNDDGTVFDWTENASGTLLKVHCSKTKPESAFVSSFYRGHWFFIEDNDLHSKSTFMFISMLFNLQSGEASAEDIAPMLTIPIAK